MKPFWREMLTDESGKASSTRFNATYGAIFGSAFALLALILVACGANVSAFAIAIVGICFGVSGANQYSAQRKSSEVLRQRVTTPPSQSSSLPSQTSASPPPSDQKAPGGGS